MTVPGAIDVIRKLAESFPEMVVGAGTVLDQETAKRCIDSGACFLTSTGLVPEVIEAALKAGLVAIPGALTPTEVIFAWKAGADYVKIFPAAPVGGDLYFRSLKLPLPHIKLIAAGGVNQQTATGFIMAGASAIGVGGELLPREAVTKRQDHRIQELSRRFLNFVKDGRTPV
jgi:2-dehydro-3-deoxyphosphogluconate aldolase/(4S)-4-hydroxy-2-oxoglutarate aldolase